MLVVVVAGAADRHADEQRQQQAADTGDEAEVEPPRRVGRWWRWRRRRDDDGRDLARVRVGGQHRRQARRGGRRSSGSTGEFRWGQVASSSMVALAHGTNDAQKTMGVISLALIANGSLKGGDGFDVPTWVVVAARPRSPSAPTAAVGASSRR